jgi:transposase-like protein
MEKSKLPDQSPYSLSIAGASEHFGLAAKTFYKWIHQGRLHRGTHYLKVGRKPVIIREAFIEFMKREDGSACQN